MRAEGRACGKLILLGEHFVVHGSPALALPLLAVETRVSVDEDGDPALELEPHLDEQGAVLARRLFEAALAALDLESPRPPWRVRVRSSVPTGQGLGSSASYAVALLRAVWQAGRGVAPPPAELDAQALALERIVHGQPSGIDNAVVARERPLWFARGEPPVALAPRRAPTLVMASSGAPRSTAAAVAAVRRRREADGRGFEALCSAATEVARAGRAALEAGDLAELGRQMDRNHELLQAIGVSTPRLDELVASARAGGAMGAKLTGAGCGGFIVALADGPSAAGPLAAALRAAGASAVLGGGA